MSWLRQPPKTAAELAQTLRARLQEGPLLLPGAYDGLSALLAKKAGFEALYLSGAALTASRGLPDLGLLEPAEVAERAREMVWATGLPLIVDADTGYGGPLNAAQAARRFLVAGVAGVQLEDQLHPKKCGHLTHKLLAPPEDLEARIRAVKAVAPELFLIARTDAFEQEGLEGVVARARRYLDAGAEAIFPEALPSREAFRRVAEALEGTILLANLTEFGRSPLLPAEELFAMGYRIALFPVSALRVAARAMEDLYQRLRLEGTTAGCLSQMQSRSELYALLDYFAYEAFDGRLARSELPEGGEG
ncbi:methylisocitrate lyase [Meiothermus sp. QL-1]|uniref:isocitrate lyase/PEP mutase family protein n=1 Tax=Meiothermus sp. QL-1 TaxID=2058095 RepID=UPI000E0B7350|nr:isocitrate lyase/phosphoenolpyruvate mutase family protein [Meiothermus sp. QL-1]RDI96633.1 methylisocitrate lyase [Meiothermus sp. QL-1]